MTSSWDCRGVRFCSKGNNLTRWINPAAGKLRSVAAFLGLLAIAIQILVVQTHVHLPIAHASYLSSLSAVSNIPLGSPVDEDQANCPLCQEMVHAGSFLLPAAILTPTPIVADSDAAAFEEIISISVTSHSWRGRAPPSV